MPVLLLNILQPVIAAQKVFQWRDYSAALQSMNHAAVAAEYSGEGTAVVQFERANLYWNAVEASNSTTLFGDCNAPRGRSKQLDSLGWVPTGADCQVAWVMCVRADSRTGDRRSCAVRNAVHATNVAKAIVAVASNTRVVSIKLARMDGRAYRDAVSFLTTPTTDANYPNRWYRERGLSARYYGYYQRIFAGKTPAEYWNLVAANVSDAPPVLVFGQANHPAGNRAALFSESCSVSNPDPAAGARPEKYVDDWLAVNNPNSKVLSVADWGPASQRLRKAGVMPLAAALNVLFARQVGDEQPEKYKSVNGVGFPACLPETFAVSGIVPDYPERNNKWQYIGTNVHPVLTDFVAPGEATSHSTPLVAGMVALLKSANLAPSASIDAVKEYLAASAKPRAKAGWSCDMRSTQTPFPEGEHPSLDCSALEDPFYEKPVLDAQAAVNAAR